MNINEITRRFHQGSKYRKVKNKPRGIPILRHREEEEDSVKQTE